MSEKPDQLVGGIRQVAQAVLAAPGASPASRALAQAVLGEIEAALGNGALHYPRESWGVAETWNHEMDVAIDAVNRTHGAENRVVRRVELSNALGRAGLVLFEVDQLASYFAASCELGLARARIDELEAKVRELAEELQSYPEPDSVDEECGPLEDRIDDGEAF